MEELTCFDYTIPYVMSKAPLIDSEELYISEAAVAAFGVASNGIRADVRCDV